MSSMIRAIGPLDLEIVAALHGACFEEAWDLQTVGELMATPAAFGLIAAAPSIAGPEPAGPEPAGFVFARLAAGDCEILSIGVRPAYRRRGLARLLMERATERALAAGADRIFLEVAEDNWAARQLYAALGFAPVGRRRNYYRRGQLSVAALTMRRVLGAELA